MLHSLKELYKTGKGPSSSHTIGPYRAAEEVKLRFPDAEFFKVILKGSLSKTGRGHMTHKAVEEALSPVKCEIVFDDSEEKLPHPNTLDFEAYKKEKLLGRIRVMSVGGGAIRIEGEAEYQPENLYPHSSFSEIMNYCIEKRIRIWEYVKEFDYPDIFEYLENIWNKMKESVREGLYKDGILEGGLGTERKAGILYGGHHMDESPQTMENRIVSSYAFAVSEQNAGGGIIVTAPTCGSAGVLPAALLYMQEKRGYTDFEITKALAVGGIIGNVIKTNASISGAECGCQAEIGSACSMASAALAELFGMDYTQIEYAAEVAMEHHLGLTCDPIKGLVQIPCIERNAVAAMRAINAVSLANFLSNTRKISFDLVVKTMYETGRDMHGKYRETAEGGLAKLY